jgi:hypothetical protein
LVGLPYFILFLGSVLWRGFFYIPLRKSFQVPTQIFSNPFAFGLEFIKNLIPDAGLTLFSSWFRVFKPEYLDFGNRINFLILAVGVTGAALTYFHAWSEKSLQTENVRDNWSFQALTVGAIGLIAGFIPVYFAGYAIYLSKWPINARFAIAAFPGAALILTALIEIVISQRARLVTIAIIAGLLIGWQFRVSNDFRQVWKMRSLFYQQLTWRIPGMKPDTAIILSNPYLPNLENDSPAETAIAPDFAIALSINAIYSAQAGQDGQIPYWYYSSFELPAGFKPNGQPIVLNEEHATLRFSGNTSNLISVYFNPGLGDCLRVLGPEYSGYAKIPPDIQTMASISNPKNILVNASPDWSFLQSIIGKDNNPTWCYLYEKADLAGQKEDWNSVLKLWRESEQKSLHATNGYENLVFITAMIKTQNWKSAYD